MKYAKNMFIIVSLSKHSYNVCVFLTMFLVLLFLHFRRKSNDVFKKFKKRSLTFSSIESYLQALLSVKIKKNVSLLKYADGAVHCRSHWSSTWLTLLRLSEEVFYREDPFSLVFILS